MVTPILKNRPAQEAASNALKQAGIHDLMARLLASRGVTDATQIDPAWRNMIPPDMLTQAREAAVLLADAIARRDRMLIIADYDCDGATACAVGLRALRSMGAVVDFLVPNRFETGYGLSPAVVELAEQHPSGKPDLLITVDNGIASIDGVEAAHMAGMKVLVTDHHLPGDELPDALAIVNPNQPGCEFPSKNLAGVGVIFYLMLALRAELRQRGVYEANAGPRLNELADLVALGTVADVVSLDANNRLIVTQGLERMRKGQMQAGLRALFQVAGRDPRQASAFDLGFALGPRINAAGRLADMALGIRCLITDDEDEAANLARELEDMNQDRRSIEQSMREEALRAAELAEPDTSATVCVFHPEWHQGIVGLVASRLKEKYWRPTLAFAQGDEGEIKGSGRSIPDVHLRDALDLVSKRYPGLILKFGGHAMAAGLTIEEDNYDVFVQAFEEAVQELTGRYQFDPIIETDGSLEPEHINITVAGLLQKQVWGAGFPAPVFRDNFFVRQQRLLKNKHLKLSLERNGEYFDAIWFNRDTLLPENIEAAYRLDQNEWNGNVSVQFIIEYAQGQD
ncbi:single-stranded-DNA-specific exonuclease RecJ [Alcaligenes faecalis]|uniref:single-stranded-DNA-specific exonuclease RecJ n=1 Tax=Alcaligenes faecalis TaxID=511 RepID=UPI000A2D0590|nr:single-stranded-DNA-specific exonuclease RecJ [Alcaligenes faecalis]OSZ46234.1 single-stranded-DNA-specific exonuclease RecJ [Alcaligenes faecalis]OSZ49982.1 single-stranded-DNA-specific exonuclease RecJ [Alcaligenes faecalis]OSZ50251.1 single-stranded-DNA-specific exonuclease RecJ [Alcaligenes faecalis]QHS36149.1 single-stranded-DNA-specific exonuclease RecJ [Alcaligenes faecalis]